MSRAKEIVLDTALILVGMGLSVLFISTDGNGQNPLPVIAGMSVGTAVIGVVSFVLGWVIRSRLFAAFATIVITELLFILYSFMAVASSPDAPEILYLLPIVLVVFTLPMVLLAAVGFVRLASCLYHRKATPAAEGHQDYDNSAS